MPKTFDNFSTSPSNAGSWLVIGIGAVKQFHLAQAHLKGGQKAAASYAYREAAKDKFVREELHPLERTEWDQFAKALLSK